MSKIETDPIEKIRRLPLNPDAAFALFTEEIGRWWPGQSHSVSAQRGGTPRRIRLEPHLGGRIIEETDAGDEAIWGTITGWRPGEYLSMTWHPGRPAKEATIVAVSFEKSEDGCILRLTHGGFDILGPVVDAVSTSYLRGWEVVLGCFAAAAAPREMAHVV